MPSARRRRYSSAAATVRPRAPASAGAPDPDAGRLPLLEKLLPYYLDCVREDAGQSARHFLTDEGKTYLVPPLPQEWSLTDTGVLDLDLGRSSFAKSLREQRGTGTIFYGYPLYVDWVESRRTQWQGGFAIPVFLLPVEYEQSGPLLQVRLLLEWPRVNEEFLKCAFASAEERQTFLREIGLLDMGGDPPPEGLAHFGRRLKELSAAPEIEAVDPAALASDPPLNTLTQEGVYNRAVLMLGERSQFTAGLEYELAELRKAEAAGTAGRSAQRCFFGAADDSPRTAATQSQLVEVVALNDEQREAVQSAFHNPLTVVTGPPGTGKSQIVVTVLANAHLRGERVLFTSRNHKAVDVVAERLNGLSSNPLVVRSGSRSGERDLRSELVRFLTQVLSASTTEQDRRAHADAAATLDALRKRRNDLWEKVERCRCARNRVDHLDRELDGLRERLAEGLFSLLSESDAPVPPGGLDLAASLVQSHLARPHSFLASIRRALVRRRDAARVEEQVSGFRMHPDLFGELPRSLSDTRDWHPWPGALARLAERVRVVACAQQYREALQELNSYGSPERFADELANLEERMWDWGARLIATYSRLLPDRLTDTVRRSVSAYRATLERLSDDRIGGRAFAQLCREQERLFATIAKVLPAWCVTNLSARGALPFEPALFDLVVIDEASQCDIPSALPLLFRAKRAMIIGDPNQLRHISTMGKQAAQLTELRHNLISATDQPYTYVNNSLYHLAAHCAGAGKVTLLREHFRSHADIVSYSNRTWYGGVLRVCTDYRRLSNVPGAGLGVRWTDVVGKTYRPAAGGAVCPEEARAVVDELSDLLVSRRFTGSVGIVTPFRAQANRIRDLVNERLSLPLIDACDLIVDTAHGFQGDERDVILFSPCIGRDLPRGAKGFLSSTGNLFNVAITRARALLHVIGDRSACAACGIPHVEGFAADLSRQAHGGKAEASSAPAPADDPRVSLWERAFFNVLSAAGVRALPQYAVHQYRLDLAIVRDGFLLDIEIDGEQFHRDLDGSRCRADVIRDWRLTMLGWRVKRFWVYQVRDAMDQCVQEVLSILAESGDAGP